VIVADTSALVSLSTAEVLETLLDEYDVHVPREVIDELEETAEYDDRHGDAARSVLCMRDEFTVHNIEDEPLVSSRVDEGEAGCAHLANEIGADYLLTDDLRALPELQTLVDAEVAISPIVLKALVKRGVLENSEAKERLDEIADDRSWLNAPIYRRARKLLE